MTGGKDEGKIMEPLFPRLHIDDADKGGPRPPPRNKMALCHQYDLPSPSVKLYNSGSMVVPPLSTSNGHCSFVPLASSNKVASTHQKVVFPTFSVPGSSHLVERYNSYYSEGVNLKASVSNSELGILLPINCQVSAGSLMPKAIECNSLQPGSCNTSHIMRSGDENSYMVPPFLQLHLDKEKRSAVTSRELQMEIRSGDQSKGHQQNDKIGKLSQNTSNRAEKPDLISQLAELDAKALLAVSHHDKSSSIPESKNITDDMCRMPERTMRKRCYSSIDDLSHSFSLLEEKNKLIKDEIIKERSKNKEFGPTEIRNDENWQACSDTSVGESLPGLDLTPDDIVEAIGQKLFWKARKIIVDQQRLFATQIFELHKLIKVQMLIAGSPEVVSQENCNLKKPYIKFPPMNKLLYVTPLDQSSPVVTKPKVSTLKPNPSRDHETDVVCRQLVPHVNNVEKVHISQQSSLPKPLFFHSLPANQWLVPVRSPSEGLIYKPYTGPCPPPVIYGNCRPIHLSTIGGPTAYGVPAPNQPGLRHFPGNALSQSYFQPYTIPLLNASCPSLEVEQSSHLSGVVSKFDKNSETSPREKLHGEELSLFPTTPCVEVQKDRCSEQKVQVIRVVPHNARSASESAARIFQSIQEERKVT